MPVFNFRTDFLKSISIDFLLGAGFGSLLAVLKFAASPWLAHYSVGLAVLDQLHSAFVYGMILFGLCLLARTISVPYLRLGLLFLVPVPFCYWIVTSSKFSKVARPRQLWLILGLSITLWLLLCGLMFLRNLVRNKSIVILMVSIVTVLLTLRVGVIKTTTTKQLLDQTYPGSEWSLDSSVAFPKSLLFPFSRSLYFWRRWLPLSNSSQQSVFVLVIDALRYDYANKKQHGNYLAPSLREFADKNIAFKNYRVQSTWTKPSVATFFTGKYLRDHGTFFGTSFKFSNGDVNRTTRTHVLPKRYETLAERLKPKDYSTLGFIINPLAGRGTQFGQGFDVFLSPNRGYHGDLYTLDQLLFYLVRERDSKKFVYLHTKGVHRPYDLGSENRRFLKKSPIYENGKFSYRPRYKLGNTTMKIALKYGDFKLPFKDKMFYRTLYASQLNAYDRRYFRRFRKLMNTISAHESALIAVTADHGEQLFEYGAFGHGLSSLRDELIHVPLILSLPHRSGIQSGIAKHSLETVDLTETILDFAGATTEKMMGRSLLTTNRNQPSDRNRFEYSYSEQIQSFSVTGQVPPRLKRLLPADIFLPARKKYIEKAAVTNPPWKFVYDYQKGRGSLYHLEQAASGNKARKGQIKTRLRKRLFDKLGSDSQLRTLDVPFKFLSGQQRQQLRNLGYIN